MNREKIYKEIEGMFGLVPSMFKSIPDSSLELEWKLFKKVQLEEGPIPNKYRELMGWPFQPSVNAGIAHSTTLNWPN
jgi:hypothetical protein